MVKQSLRFVLVFITVLMMGCFTSNPPPYDVWLSVPYHEAEEPNYCAVACIQMWAEYLSIFVTQDEIAAVFPHGISSGGYLPDDVAIAASIIINRDIRVIEDCYWWNPGAQGDILAIAVQCGRLGRPSIFPFYGGIHSVLATGYDCHEEEPDIPIVDAMFYHDPDPFGGPDCVAAANDLKDYYFTMVQGFYFIIIQRDRYTTLRIGQLAHDSFVLSGGNYYGGPSVYNPKGLTLNPSLVY